LSKVLTVRREERIETIAEDLVEKHSLSPTISNCVESEYESTGVSRTTPK